MNRRNFRSLQRLSVWAAVAVVVVQPQMMFAAEQEALTPPAQHVVQAMRVVDVELQQGGLLHGQLVDKQGKALATADVVLASGRSQWRTKTDQQGRFQVAGLNGNTYRIAVGQQVQLVRAWSTGTAPPKTVAGLLVVQDNGVVLGQHCAAPVCGSAIAAAKHPLANPWVFGGLVAAAIAIPVAIHNSDDDEASP